MRTSPGLLRVMKSSPTTGHVLVDPHKPAFDIDVPDRQTCRKFVARDHSLALAADRPDLVMAAPLE
jgi:hypothetical protein